MFVLAFMARDLTLDDYLAESSIDLTDEGALERDRKRVVSDSYYKDMYIELIRQSAIKCPDYLFLLKKHPVEDSYLINWDGPSRYDRLENLDNVIFIDEPKQISLYCLFIGSFGLILSYLFFCS